MRMKGGRSLAWLCGIDAGAWMGAMAWMRAMACVWGVAACGGQARSDGELSAAPACRSGSCLNGAPGASEEAAGAGRAPDPDAPSLDRSPTANPVLLPTSEAPSGGACNPLSDWVSGDRVSAARVEARALASSGEQLLLVGAQAATGDAELRAFFGSNGRLREKRIVGLARALDDGIEVLRFSIDIAGEQVEVVVPALQSTDDEFSVRIGSRLGGELLNDLPRTRISLEGLRFECSAASVGGWRLSNQPATHDPIALCPEALLEFHCFSLPAAASLGPDQPTASQGVEVTVSAIGEGVPPATGGDACIESIANALYSYPEWPIVWAGVAVGTERGIIALRSPGVALPFGVGDTLRVYRQRRGFYPGETLTLRRSSGELVLWSSRAASLDETWLPEELSLTRGAEQCAATSGCYHVSQLGYDVKLGAETRHVAYGERAAIAGYTFVHLGLEIPTASLPSCFDGDAGRADAELWATPGL